MMRLTGTDNNLNILNFPLLFLWRRQGAFRLTSHDLSQPGFERLCVLIALQVTGHFPEQFDMWLFVRIARSAGWHDTNPSYSRSCYAPPKI